MYVGKLRRGFGKTSSSGCIRKKGVYPMANKTKSKSSGSWKKERASVNRKNGSSKPRSNKYRPASDTGKRSAAGTGERYWRAGYTRSDGTKVKGHYVTKRS
jgi:hypothetical protein